MTLRILAAAAIGAVVATGAAAQEGKHCRFTELETDHFTLSSATFAEGFNRSAASTLVTRRMLRFYRCFPPRDCY